jgi:hypothetical protein
MLNGVSVTPNTPVSLQQITDIKNDFVDTAWVLYE